MIRTFADEAMVVAQLEDESVFIGIQLANLPMRSVALNSEETQRLAALLVRLGVGE